ncbi:hypothetical protein BGZ83_009205 [Gryganskiella cystojenkinii]|nr:hypothetical protein BGZ83_009205 [Gryganskiella cystojenkinii]
MLKRVRLTETLLGGQLEDLDYNINTFLTEYEINNSFSQNNAQFQMTFKDDPSYSGNHEQEPNNDSHIHHEHRHRTGGHKRSTSKKRPYSSTTTRVSETPICSMLTEFILSFSALGISNIRNSYTEPSTTGQCSLACCHFVANWALQNSTPVNNSENEDVPPTTPDATTTTTTDNDNETNSSIHVYTSQTQEHPQPEPDPTLLKTTESGPHKHKCDEEQEVEEATERTRSTTPKKKKIQKKETLEHVDHRPLLERVPVELWLHIMSFIPSSHLATTLSLVSKMMLSFCRSLPRWKSICEQHNFGEPKRRYKTYMALVCSESYFLCDRCDSRTMGPEPRRRYYCSSSEIPVWVWIKTGGDHDVEAFTERLCRSCRCRSYMNFVDHDEILDAIDPNERVSSSLVLGELRLQQSDLEGLDFHPFRITQSDYGRRDRVVRVLHKMYSLRELTEVAMAVHGGWAGIKAAKTRRSSMLLAMYKERKKPIKRVLKYDRNPTDVSQ